MKKMPEQIELLDPEEASSGRVWLISKTHLFASQTWSMNSPSKGIKKEREPGGPHKQTIIYKISEFSAGGVFGTSKVWN